MTTTTIPNPTGPTHSPTSSDGAAVLGQVAVRYWLARGAMGVGYEVYPLDNGLWSYRLTGLTARALPAKWRDGLGETA